jgi:hypothetical protein
MPAGSSCQLCLTKLFGYKAIIFYTSRDTTKLAFLKLAVLVSGVLALAKLGFLDFITGGFDPGRFGGLPIFCIFSFKI